MASDSRFCFGDVLLVPFPFTDQSGTKKRPAVVVSNRDYNTSRRDIVIMAITSQVRSMQSFAEALVADWQAAGLIKVSVFKPVFTTLEQSLVLRTMGQLSANDLRTLREIVATALGDAEAKAPAEPV